jgi:hypothetical protein
MRRCLRQMTFSSSAISSGNEPVHHCALLSIPECVRAHPCCAYRCAGMRALVCVRARVRVCLVCGMRGSSAKRGAVFVFLDSSFKLWDALVQVQ